jgi:hypothetical protein
LYQLRSARQRLELQFPAGATFDTEPLRINGKSVSLESGAANQYFIPLVGQDPDTPFLLELRYTMGNQTMTFDLPAFVDADDPAMQKVYLCAYLPEEQAVRTARGPWTDEIVWRWGATDWRYSGGKGYAPVPVRTDAELVSWVMQGTATTTNPLESFQKDGRLFVFSAVRPQPAPQGSLSLSVIHRTLLNWIVLLAFIVAAVGLARQSLAVKAVSVGFGIATLVFLSVFQPMLIHEMINSVFFWGIALMAIVWIVAAFLRRRSRPVELPPTSGPPPVTEPSPTPNPSPSAPSEGPTTGGEHHG